MNRLLLLLSFFGWLFLPAFAQTSQKMPYKQLGLFNYKIIADYKTQKTGIEILDKTVRKFQINRLKAKKEYDQLSAEQHQLGYDLLDSKFTSKELTEKRIRYDELKVLLAKLSGFDQRETVRLINPILKIIFDEIKFHQEQNGLAIFYYLDSPKKFGEYGLILNFDKKLEITDLLIYALNSYFKTGKRPNLKINLPSPKIGRLEPDAFFTKYMGKENYSKSIRAFYKTYQSEKEKALASGFSTSNIGIWEQQNLPRIQAEFPKVLFDFDQTIDRFAKINGFHLILNLRNRTDGKFMDFDMQDVTDSCISYYNQINP